MKKILIYLVPVAIVLGITFLYIKQKSEALSFDRLHQSDDLVFMNIPDIQKNYFIWSKNSIFKHLLEFEGVKEISAALAVYSKEIAFDPEANLALIIKANGGLVLVLEHEMDQGLWNELTGKGINFTKKINGKTWHLKAKDQLLFASLDPKNLDGFELSETTLEINWNQLFVTIHAEKLSKALKLDQGILDQMVHSLKNICYSINFKNNKLISSGFDKHPESKLMKALKWQGAVLFDFKELLLVRFNAIKLWQFNDGEAYVKENKIDLDPKLFDFLRLAEVHFDTPEKSNASVFILQTFATERLINPSLGNMIVTSEGMNGYTLYQLKNQNFLGEKFPAFLSEKLKYVALFGNHAILSNEIHHLRYYTSQITDKQVWANSNEQMKWVDDELIECNFLEVNKPYALLNSLTKSSIVGGYFYRNQKAFMALPMLVHQKSVEKNGIYSGITLNLAKGENTLINIDTAQVSTTDSLSDSSNTAIALVYANNSALVSAPKMIKSGGASQNQFLLFDSKNTVFLVDAKGKMEWRFNLEGKLISEIFEVDVFKNKNIQYLFATDKKIYCIDKLGKIVEHFPIALPNRAAVHSLNVIDYDGSKTYRIAATSGKNVYLFDTKGAALEGWNPATLTSNAVGKVQHFRNQNTDYLLVKEENGQINMLQRRANIHVGFPLKQTFKLSSVDATFIKGSNADNAFISLVMQDGTTKTYSLSGKSKTTKKLPVSDIKSKVYLEQKNGICTYAASSSTKTYVFDADLTQIFSHASAPKTLLGFQSYLLAGKKIYVFHYQHMTEIVSDKGLVLLTNIPTQENVVLQYSSTTKKVDVFYNTQNGLKKENFNF